MNWLSQGKIVQAFIVTSGVVRAEFNSHPQANEKQKAKEMLRAQESCLAAQILGMPEPVFLARQDGELLDDKDIEGIAMNVLEAWQPTTIVVPSIWEMHRDHRATAQLGIHLAKHIQSTERLTFYEIGVPLPPNCLEDVTEYYSNKQSAMQCFQSQLKEQRYNEQIQGLNSYRSYTLGQAVHYAEAYFSLAVSELDKFMEVHQPQSMTTALRSAEQALAAQNHRLKSLEAKLIASEAELAIAERHVSSIKSSLSWRITCPLRRVRSLFKTTTS